MNTEEGPGLEEMPAAYGPGGAVPDQTLTKLYPEMAAGGFTHVDQVWLFFLRVNALLQREMTVLDFGAGRGEAILSADGFLKGLQSFRGRCAHLYGADVDPVVMTNATVDTPLLIENGRIPLPDLSIDLVVSSATFEHVSDPEIIARELERVIKPGGWICAWTPSKYGYVALGARVVPNSLHAKAVAKLGDRRGKHDVFPTVYRLNTKSAIRRYFPSDKFLDCSYYLGGSPTYHAGIPLLARFWRLYNALVPGPLKKNLHVFLQKRG